MTAMVSYVERRMVNVDPVKAEFWRLARGYLTPDTDVGLQILWEGIRDLPPYNGWEEEAIDCMVITIYERRKRFISND